jgi:hypothetical protein
MLDDAEGINNVETVVWEWQFAGIRANEPVSIHGGFSPDFGMAGKVNAIGLNPSSRKLGYVLSEATADVEGSLDGLLGKKRKQILVENTLPGMLLPMNIAFFSQIEIDVVLQEVQVTISVPPIPVGTSRASFLVQCRSAFHA